MSIAVLDSTQSPAIGRPAVTALPAGPAALLVDHVTKRFKVDRRKPPVMAVDNVSIRMERGEIYGLLGANGSGKSTFIRLVSGLLTLDEGRVEVVDAAFFKKLSPAENLSFAARLYGMDARQASREAVRIMGRLGIGEKRLNRPVEQMSRGMQQKVAIARALLTSPTLLLLDEPTTGLDPRSKLDVQAFIEELQADHDATIVLTTHDLAEADRLCGRIGILAGGQLTAEGTPERLKADIATEHGLAPTLESVFMKYTGRSLDDDVEQAETDQPE